MTTGEEIVFTLKELANLILAVGPDATDQDIRQRARCNHCGVKDNDNYQIVWRGNSRVVLDSAGGVKPTKG